MSHRATASFWRSYEELPEAVRRLADKNFALLKDDPRHPSLQLKKVGELWSARIGGNYRALALETGEGLTWIWIGTHADYDRLTR
jgi:mRNA-degrading endonuclease RelE of RelBE toxin-antitoxin system